ncbi:MAG: nickel pincer cofactor biosynthesis protein LarC [Moorellaceae bacterium]
MKIAYFDCFSGISGDMCLGALLACGLPLSELKAGLETLPLDGWELKVKPVRQHGIQGIDVEVEVQEPQPERHLRDIEEIIAASGLPQVVKDKALLVFRRLASAEARVHGVSPEEVHFHEVGAVDAVIDIVGTCWGIHLLGVEQVYSSPLPLGSGWVRCRHGELPIPAPATVYLLEGCPVYGSEVQTELVTPTGAALITSLATAFRPLPPMSISACGYGSGKSRFDRPNFLRLFLGEASSTVVPEESLMVVETALDDMNPEFLPFLIEQTLAAGAVDAFFTPVHMKKGRPGVVFTALCPRENLYRVTSAIFRHSSTLGVRFREEVRLVARRQVVTVETPYGPVQVKWGIFRSAAGDTPSVNVAPEYESCRRVATEKNIPLKDIYAAALSAAQTAGPPPELASD